MARPDITELGESLLSGKIERVRRQEKRAEKDQRKALLMGLGLQLGAGAVQSIFDRKQQNIADTILNSETRRLYNMTDIQNKEYMTYKQKLADQGLSVFDFEFNRHYEKLKALNEWEGIDNKLFKAQDKLDREQATKAAEEQVRITNRLDKLYAGISTKEELVERYKDKFNRPTNLLSYLGGKIGDAVTGQSQEEREAMVLEQIRKENLVPLEEYNTVVQLWKDSRNRKTKAALIKNYVDDPYAPKEYTTGIKRKADGTVILTKVQEVYDESKGAWRATSIETETLGAEAVAKQVLAANRADGAFLTQALNSTNEKGRAALTAMNKKASKIDNFIERSAFIVSGATDILLNEEYRKTSLDPLQKESLEMLQNRIRNDEFAFTDDDGNIDFDGMKDYYDSTHAMLKSVTSGFTAPSIGTPQQQEVSVTDSKGNTITAKPVSETTVGDVIKSISTTKEEPGVISQALRSGKLAIGRDIAKVIERFKRIPPSVEAIISNLKVSNKEDHIKDITRQIEDIEKMQGKLDLYESGMNMGAINRITEGTMIGILGLSPEEMQDLVNDKDNLAWLKAYREQLINGEY